MNRIDHEIRLLLQAADAGELPGYKDRENDRSFYAALTAVREIEEYDSGENDIIEKELSRLWSDEPEMKKYIPLILAAVEKSRSKKEHAIVRTELYNYTM